jgi:hypothetical protein
MMEEEIRVKILMDEFCVGDVFSDKIFCSSLGLPVTLYAIPVHSEEGQGLFSSWGQWCNPNVTRLGAVV